MEPRIQYVKSADGTRIACWSTGAGKPLVYMASLHWASSAFLGLPWAAGWNETLASHRLFIRYDGRGTGHSQRGLEDYSLKAQVADLEAVADRLAKGPFELFATFHASPVAITFAARHPERVDRLILWHPWSNGQAYAESGNFKAFISLRSMAEENWDLYVSTMAATIFSTANIDVARAADAMRDSVAPNDILRILHAFTTFNADACLSEIRSPTLVLIRRGVDIIPRSEILRVAAQIPEAHLVALEGREEVPYLGDADSVLRALWDFLGEEDEGAKPPEPPSGTAIILFVDIADSTALTERLGDAAFRAKARDLDATLRTVIREDGGTPIEGKLLGDGVLAVFTSARQAIEAALACGKAGDDGGLPLHLGLHAGDVIRESDADGRSNVYGGAVNIASRISGLSAPGQVLVSKTVRSLARTSAGVRFEDRGEQALKGVGEPVRVWAVREAE